jgi:hypothetical protein
MIGLILNLMKTALYIRISKADGTQNTERQLNEVFLVCIAVLCYTVTCN